MKFLEITIKDGFFRKTVLFSDGINMIYSQNNSAGKTTFIRCILYALGYPIPSTKGLKFENMEFELILTNNEKMYKLQRRNMDMTVEVENEQLDYLLPTDFYEIMEKLTSCNNADIIDNMLGACYMDQEKGWTLLNRGKVIGNIAFNIEELVRGLAGKKCDDQLKELEAVKKQLKKYEYMYSVARYQTEINQEANNIVYDSSDEIIDKKIEILRLQKMPLEEELKQVKDILRKNKLLVDYINDLKLIVQSDSGEQIPVTYKNLLGFTDNMNFLSARRKLLSGEVEHINREINRLIEKKEKEIGLVKVQTIIEKFDSNISKIKIDQIATQNVIDNLKKKKKQLQDEIKNFTKMDNPVVPELHEYINKYAKELGIDETYVSPNKDYIFTNDLKSLTGTILHKIVFSFKLAYIKMIKEKAGIMLPIILDSPSGREVKKETVNEMLEILQRDFSEHQIIIASIYNFDICIQKTINFKNRLFEDEDFVSNMQ